VAILGATTLLCCHRERRLSIFGEEVVSNCCETTKEGTCSLPTSKLGVCPSGGKKGKPVAVLTVKSLVRDHTRVPVSISYSFCRTVDCYVVYFSDQVVFTKPDLRVRVGAKETADPIPLCYCFDYSREVIRRDIEATGQTSALEEIKAEVQAGFCACEVKNPSGNCCLGTSRVLSRKQRNVRQRRFPRLIELLPRSHHIRLGSNLAEEIKS
jgi:hypothetical protein